MTITYFSYIVRLSYYTTHPPQKKQRQLASPGAVTWNKQQILSSIPSEFARPYARLRFTEGEKHIDSGSVVPVGPVGEGWAKGGRRVGEGWYGGSWRKMMTTCEGITDYNYYI